MNLFKTIKNNKVTESDSTETYLIRFDLKLGNKIIN